MFRCSDIRHIVYNMCVARIILLVKMYPYVHIHAATAQLQRNYIDE